MIDIEELEKDQQEVIEKTNIDILAKNFLIKNKLKFIVITKGISGVVLFDHKLKKYFVKNAV